MLFSFLQFHFKLWRPYLLPQLYRGDFIFDDEHHQTHYHYRRFGKQYQKKQGIVKNIWIGVGLVTIIFPILPLIAVLLISTTFLSFSILDETE